MNKFTDKGIILNGIFYKYGTILKEEMYECRLRVERNKINKL